MAQNAAHHRIIIIIIIVRTRRRVGIRSIAALVHLGAHFIAHGERSHPSYTCHPWTTLAQLPISVLTATLILHHRDPRAMVNDQATHREESDRTGPMPARV